MLMERNTLMEWVYPKIKEYCKEKHGLEFQVGILEGETDENNNNFAQKHKQRNRFSSNSE